MSSDYNILMHQFNGTDFDNLYPQTLDGQIILSENNQLLYGTNATAQQAFESLGAYLTFYPTVVMIKVVNSSGTGLPDCEINGMVDTDGSTVYTNDDGYAAGLVSGTTITVNPNSFIDVQQQTINVENYKGVPRILTITLATVNNNTIIRLTSSQDVIFSTATSIDICLVGGGGAGYCQFNASSYGGGGGGAGAIINQYNISISPFQSYSVVIGAGATHSNTGIVRDGSSTTAFGYTAVGGNGGSGHSGGDSGTSGSGNGGHGLTSLSSADSTSGYNSTISEFNDGTTYYGGGGGGGNGGNNASAGVMYGGSPYGGNGGIYGGTASTISPATSGTYGGGGGGGYATTNVGSDAADGGDGLIAIKIHIS